MIALEFTCKEPRVSFGEHFNAFGSVDGYRWEDFEGWPGFDPPSLGKGQEFTWRIATESSVLRHYEAVLEEWRRPLSPRMSKFQDYWAKARGMIWSYEGETSITIASPRAAGFEAFMVGAVAGELCLTAYIPGFTFASRDDAPAPTPEAFEAGEPVFFTQQPIFGLQRPPRIADVPTVPATAMGI